jgi:hypothetical protein
VSLILLQCDLFLTLYRSNYEQLGLKFNLFSAEVLFNRGLCLIYMGRLNEGLAEMEEARKVKVTEEHGVIDEAIQDKGQGYTVFSIVSHLPSPPGNSTDRLAACWCVIPSFGEQDKECETEGLYGQGCQLSTYSSCCPI